MVADHAEVDNDARLNPVRPGFANPVYSMNSGPIKSYECFLDLLLRPLVQRTPVIP
jgi:hypothetical protein